jgi:hypothetical protein
MNKTKPWYVRERAEALAIVYLTDRSDLVVTKPRTNHGLDLIVDLVKEDRPTKRSFGIVLEGTQASLTETKANRLLTAALRLHRGEGIFPFPVCLFLFGVRNNEAFFTWLAEPIVTKGGKPKLHVPKTAACQKPSAETLDEIVTRVLQWYDALFSVLAI